ncbi:hypothetical protein PI23P_02552 [Polaribacter irgensii 23-P]|uniref:Uncharacterized protein n=1 Tax=Polaribacter irgensii 23-P TaxID=313594 RepID=A4BWJ7_9FLAO|nr:hypothetical protein PI23P_02552 [Polaribacter irgensii 23-P]
MQTHQITKANMLKFVQNKYNNSTFINSLKRVVNECK